MRTFSSKVKFAGLALVAGTSVAMAAVTFDPESGTGFVGKGDVQLALGLNNAQLQAGSYAFAYVGEEVSEQTWQCTNIKNEHVQERTRTTTTSIAGLVSSTARVKNQITGFNINGYSGTVTTSVGTDGPPLNSCPANFWLTTEAGPADEVSSSGGLTVNGTALQ